jgi:hypothetical protein
MLNLDNETITTTLHSRSNLYHGASDGFENLRGY